MRVILTGGTGLIGRALTASLVQDDHQVVTLSRRAAPDSMLQGNAVEGTAFSGKVQWVHWPEGETWVNALEGADAVIHLAGEPIAGKRWNSKQKQRILESRQQGTRRLVDALGRLSNPPHTLLSASAVGYYGFRGEEEVTENDPPGDDFLARVCEAWEAEARRAESFGLRVVFVRTGLVLAPQGGALAPMLIPFRFLMGGPLGRGQQWMSWIHLQDEVGIFRFLLEQESVAGPFNATAPHPVTNRTFSRTLGEVLHRPARVSAPAFLLRLALGEMADALLLNGQRAVPKRLQELGYPFRFTELKPALEAVLSAHL
ncbi:MAG: TIGR01777 family protein [Firmicutes bacterium]|nr:TIGR01777 family protein [Bacillota bacterium]